MDIQLVLKSDEEVENIEYFLEIKNWTQEFMDVHINFTDPLLISKGLKLDEIICKILNKDLFQAKFSSMVLMSDRIYIQKSLPRQLPRGIDEKSLSDSASSASSGMKAMMGV